MGREFSIKVPPPLSPLLHQGVAIPEGSEKLPNINCLVCNNEKKARPERSIADFCWQQVWRAGYAPWDRALLLTVVPYPSKKTAPQVKVSHYFGVLRAILPLADRGKNSWKEGPRRDGGRVFHGN